MNHPHSSCLAVLSLSSQSGNGRTVTGNAKNLPRTKHVQIVLGKVRPKVATIWMSRDACDDRGTPYMTHYGAHDPNIQSVNS